MKVSQEGDHEEDNRMLCWGPLVHEEDNPMLCWGPLVHEKDNPMLCWGPLVHEEDNPMLCWSSLGQFLQPHIYLNTFTSFLTNLEVHVFLNLQSIGDNVLLPISSICWWKTFSNNFEIRGTRLIGV